MDERTGFTFVNLNILTDDECEKLFEYQKAKDDGVDTLNWNKDYEICTGKKHKFPQKLLVKRGYKASKVLKEEQEKAKKC